VAASVVTPSGWGWVRIGALNLDLFSLLCFRVPALPCRATGCSVPSELGEIVAASVAMPLRSGLDKNRCFEFWINPAMIDRRAGSSG
jgi:hypothetical protein